MMEPIPLIDKAFTLVIQEERQRYLEFNVVLQLNQLPLLSRIKVLIKVLVFRAMMARIIRGILGKEGLCAATVANLASSWRNAIS